MQKTQHTIDMCSGSVIKKMLLFAFPLMLSGVLQLLFNAADVIVVGNFAGKDSLAAVGSTTALINLLTNLFIGLSIGANVLVARYVGAAQLRHVKETVHTAMLLSVLCGVLLTVIGMIGAPTILTWMQTPAEVLDLAVVYLRTYFIGMIAMMIYNFGAAILRAVGDTRRPLWYLIVAGVINVTFNLIFVIVFRWGVFGVGLATAISQIVSATLVALCLFREKGAVRLEWRAIRLYKDKLMKILQVGLPAGLQGSLFSIANVVIQSSVNGFGNIVVAGNSASANIEGFGFMAMNAFHQAAISFTGQNLGAGRTDRIPKVIYTALSCVAVTAVAVGGTMFLLARPLLMLYNRDPDVIDAGLVRLQIMALSLILAGVMDVLVGVLRGLGYSVMPMIVSLVGVCALRLVWLWTVFQIPAYHTIDMIYITYPISWAVTLTAHAVCLVFAWRYQKGQLAAPKPEGVTRKRNV